MNKALDFTKACFVKTAMTLQQCPIVGGHKGEPLAEVAVVGRSNVGKSSLLNHLFQKKGLVKTSATPGKTQGLNFFSVDESLLMADLPGYGFAKVPEKIRKEWAPMIESYLKNRSGLRILLLLLDVRREPGPEDKQFLIWADALELPVIVVLTKMDKVSPSESNMRKKQILDALNWSETSCVPYTIMNSQSRLKLIAMMMPFIQNR